MNLKVKIPLSVIWVVPALIWMFYIDWRIAIILILINLEIGTVTLSKFDIPRSLEACLVRYIAKLPIIKTEIQFPTIGLMLLSSAAFLPNTPT